MLGGGIGKVRQQRVLGPGLVAGQVVAFDLCGQGVGGGVAAQQAGHHHQHAVHRRHTVVEGQARQAARRQPFAQQAVPGRHRDLRGRPQHQQQHRHDTQAAIARRPVAQRWQGLGQQRQRGGGDDGQVHRQARARPALGPGRWRRCGHAQGRGQGGAAAACQPIPGGVFQRSGCVGLRDLLDERPGDRQFVAPAAPRPALQCVQRAVLRRVVFVGEGRQVAQRGGQGAVRVDPLAPAKAGHGAQAAHGLGHVGVVRGIGRLLRLLRHRRLRQVQVPAAGRHQGRIGVAAAGLQLQQEGPRRAARPQCPDDAAQHLGRGRRARGDGVGQRARGLVGGHALAQPAQLLHQHQAQHLRQGPPLAPGRFAHGLVAAEKRAQQGRLEVQAAGLQPGPGDVQHARRADGGAGAEQRQVAEPAGGQTVGDVAELFFDQRQVVRQPLRRRAGVDARLDVMFEHRRGLAQHLRVAPQPGDERGAAVASADRGLVEVGQRQAVFGHGLRAQRVAGHRVQQGAAGGLEKVDDRGVQRRRAGRQSTQAVGQLPPALRGHGLRCR